jgi:uncharacterized protein YpmS
MADENGRKYLTWQWLTGILMGLVLLFGGWAWNDTRACLKDNQVELKQKVDKDQYQMDIKRIEIKLDTLINMQLKENGNKKR